jgi:undecaprenyl-diphosphatase
MGTGRADLGFRMNPLFAGLAGSGLVFFLVGLGYRQPLISRWDAAVFEAVQGHTQHPAVIAIFRAIWLAGTTPFLILMLAGLFFRSQPAGLLASVIYLWAALIERVVKVTLKRPRPFQALPETVVRQPRLPIDASFPSGDCLRAWFLAIALPLILRGPWQYTAAALLIACLVAAGRLVMGVHYPSDVLAGTGLGILFAGTFLLISGVIS